MARARLIKPGFFLNDELAEVNPLGRILFAGLWTVADREGRLEDRAKKIKAELLPYDDCNVDKLLSDLHERGFIIRYAANGKRYIQIVNFEKHQTPHQSEKKSEIPAFDANTVQEQDLSCISTVQEQDKNNTNPSLTLNPYTLTINPKPLTPDLEPLTPNESADALSHAGARKDSPAPVDNTCGKVVDRFLEFWAEYPRKTGKGAAEKAYMKIKPSKELHETMIRAVRAACLSRQWRRDGGQYIPNPATWLNQRRWEDEPQAEAVYSEKADIADRAISMLENLEARQNDERE